MNKVNLDEMVELVSTALEDMKGNDIIRIDVRGKMDVTDIMVVASGSSDRHVQALADQVVDCAKKNNLPVLGVERDRAWVLIDLCDIVVHVMLPETRDFYNIEKLWQHELNNEQIQH